jgi:phosphohistidine phosphatase
MTLAIKNLILWRHAEAELADIALSVGEDMARKLTSKGQRQAKLMARWLQEQLPKNLMLLSSPAVRAFQTAETLKHNINVHPALKPGATIQEVLTALANIESHPQNVLIVGHQPWLGALAGYLTGSAEINIKKGAIWWLRQSLINPSAANSKLAQASFSILTVQTPSLMR